MAARAGSDHPTPSDFSVISPLATRDSPSPEDDHLSANAQTPTMRAIQVKTHFDRAKFFVQGQIDEFVKDMLESDEA
jgi:hypothetical protein